MQAASGEIVAFIDDDCEAHEDWLSATEWSSVPGQAVS
jgi:hypothetical protein